MKSIIAPFTPHKKHDQNTTSNSYRQPQDINSGVAFITKEVSERYFEIVFKHKEVISCM
jgi:hypothetical protein